MCCYPLWVPGLSYKPPLSTNSPLRQGVLLIPMGPRLKLQAPPIYKQSSTQGLLLPPRWVPGLSYKPRWVPGRQPTAVNEGGNPPLVNNTSPRGGVLLPPRPRVSNRSIHEFLPLFWLVANPWPRGQQHTTPRRSVIKEGGIPPLVNNTWAMLKCKPWLPPIIIIMPLVCAKLLAYPT